MQIKINLFYEHERIGQGLQSLKGLKSLINFDIHLARDLRLNLLTVLFLEISSPLKVMLLQCYEDAHTLLFTLIYFQCTPAPQVPTSSVLGLVASFQSAIVQQPHSEASQSSLEDKDSDSNSSSGNYFFRHLFWDKELRLIEQD